MTWTITVPPGPADTLEQRADAAVAAHKNAQQDAGALTDGVSAQIDAAIQALKDLVHAGLVAAEHVGATISGHHTDGTWQGTGSNPGVTVSLQGAVPGVNPLAGPMTPATGSETLTTVSPPLAGETPATGQGGHAPADLPTTPVVGTPVTAPADTAAAAGDVPPPNTADTAVPSNEPSGVGPGAFDPNLRAQATPADQATATDVPPAEDQPVPPTDGVPAETSSSGAGTAASDAGTVPAAEPATTAEDEPEDEQPA